ncbi:MAG: hypothetical protein ACWGMZ_08425, partial [Thermoguttaceae bacterium]
SPDKYVPKQCATASQKQWLLHLDPRLLPGIAQLLHTVCPTASSGTRWLEIRAKRLRPFRYYFRRLTVRRRQMAMIRIIQIERIEVSLRVCMPKWHDL